MGHFPLFLNLTNRRVLIVGSTPAALDKRQRMKPFCARVEHIDTLSQEDLLDPPALVIAASACREENQQISALCQCRCIPVNVVDDPSLCTFFFPALVTRGDLTVGISTAGVSPTTAALVRRRVEQALPDRMEDVLVWAQELRQWANATVPCPKQRAALLRRAVSLSMDRNRPLTDGELADLLTALSAPACSG